MGVEDFRKNATVTDKGLVSAFQHSVGESRGEETAWFTLTLNQHFGEKHERTEFTCTSVEHLVQKTREAVLLAIASGADVWGMSIVPYEKEEAEPSTLSREGSIKELPKET